MKKNIVFFLLFIVTSNYINAQLKKDQVLFTVGDENVSANEFIRVYNKNLNLVQDQSQKDVDEYLKLYEVYKLKLHEARDLNFDKKESYIKEFNRYKKQLSNNYLTNAKVTEQLVKEAYQRTLTEVNVDHILVKLDANAIDTLEAYNKVLGYRDLLKTENDFSKIKEKLHDGKTLFAEQLGYFSAFKVVYPFENLAYNTPIGQVSMPFRTQFGYHILKVNDKRPSFEVTVAHVMVSNQKKDKTANIKERINEIYNLYKKGQKFEDLAKQYSDDQSTANRGGKLSPFKAGQLGSTVFEERALKLEPNEVSEPIETKYGWHIIKLIEKNQPKSFEKSKSALELQVKRDSRSKLIDQQFINDLKLLYKIPQNFDLTYFENILNENVFKNEWSVPVDLTQDKILIDFGDKKVTYLDFANYIEMNQKQVTQQESYNLIVKNLFQSFLRQKLINYHENNLENVNPEYAAVVSEYRDGLLLFDIMQEKIWDAVKNDTVALKNYFLSHKDDYLWPKRFDVNIVSGSEKSIVEKARQILQEGKTITQVKEQLNSNGENNIITTSGLFTKDYQAFPSNFNFLKGLSEIYKHNNAFHVIMVKDIKEETQKAFNEAKGKVISDYQQVVEKKWIQELRQKYPVKVNKKVLKKVKKILTK